MFALSQVMEMKHTEDDGYYICFVRVCRLSVDLIRVNARM
jgi:hypothetical protein